jgi:hypothetical protein
MDYKTIKKIDTKRYSIHLRQYDDGYFRVHSTKLDGKEETSSDIQDYKTASVYFDYKLKELQGH